MPRLRFFNGLGGSRRRTRIRDPLAKGQQTPSPWINVVANPRLRLPGVRVRARLHLGANSRENQLTPWSNDPVTDPPGEAYLPAGRRPAAVGADGAADPRSTTRRYVARHGQGYSAVRAQRAGHRAASSTQFVAPDAPIKISRLVLTNRRRRRVELAVTAYVEWVLGPSRARERAVHRHDARPATAARCSRAIRATASSPSAVRVLRRPCAGVESLTCDRTEFLGRNGRARRAGRAVDGSACPGGPARASIRARRCSARVELAPGASARLALPARPGATPAEAQRAGRALSARATSTPCCAASTRDWDERARHRRGRDAGPRDRTSCSTAGCCTRPSPAGCGRARLLPGRRRVRLPRPAAGRDGAAGRRARRWRASRSCAPRAHQFEEGDVQHWWHPPSGAACAPVSPTTCVWLPYVVAALRRVTGDAAILDEHVPFLEGQPLDAGRARGLTSRPSVSRSGARVYEHCARALDTSLAHRRARPAADGHAATGTTA